MVEGAARGGDDVIGPCRLREVFEGAEPHGLLRGFDAGIAGDHDHLALGPALFECPQHADAIGSGHREVEEHEVERLVLHRREGLCAIRGHLRIALAACEDRRVAAPYGLVVIDDEHMGSCRHDRVPQAAR